MNIVQTDFTYRNPLIPLNLLKVLYIIVHHTEADSSPPEQIHKWHLDNGWDGFGYNELVMKDGTVYIGRGYNIGAQCANMNSKSFGIAVEGNYEKDNQMPQAQFNSLVERIKYNKDKFPNFIKIAPHNELVATSCPGKYYPLDRVVQEVNNNSDTLIAAVKKLNDNNIIATPQYWLENAIPNKTVLGEFAGLLIKKFANRL